MIGVGFGFHFLVCFTLVPKNSIYFVCERERVEKEKWWWGLDSLETRK